VLVPAAVVGGAALAIANARADAERDASAGTDSVAIRLGPDRSGLLNAGLVIAVLVAALGTLSAKGDGRTGALGVAVVASLMVVAGIVLGRGNSARRERAWELEAVGFALLAAAWIAGVRLGG
jgi:4-hydroxybenzoate polyprenyltransferase